MKRRAVMERELFLRFAPRVRVEQPVDPMMGKKGKPTAETIEAAMKFNRQLQETIRQKLLAILLKKKIIRRLTKRLERKSPRGMALFLANEMSSKTDVNQTAFMGANKIAILTVTRARNLKEPSQSQAVNAVRYAPTKNVLRNKSATLKKPKQVTPSMER